MPFSKAYNSEVIASWVTISSMFKCCLYAVGQFQGIGIHLKVSVGIEFTLKTLKKAKVVGNDALVGISPFLWHLHSVVTCFIQRKATETSL